MSADVAGVVVGLIALVVGAIGAFAALRSNWFESTAQSQEEFRDVRRQLKEHRPALVELAAKLHTSTANGPTTVPRTHLLTDPQWMPDRPVPLDAVRLSWVGGRVGRAPQKILRAARRVLPVSTGRRRFDSYSNALGALARPTLFFDNPTFSLVASDWTDPASPQLSFSECRYFPTIDIAEALCHELASVAISGPDGEVLQPSWRSMPLRRAMRSRLLDPTLRPISIAVSTLLIRRKPDGNAEFFLNLRDAEATVTYAGAYMVVPTGVFQPGSKSPAALREDFDLWRTIMREFSEEVLGNPEADGTLGMTVDYANESPYVELDQARLAGEIRPYYLGFGLDAVELWAHVLTAVVVDDAAFGRIAPTLVEKNAEGIMIGHVRTKAGIRGIPLSKDQVDFYLSAGMMSSPSAACLALAWQHRSLLLS
ncbi:transcriptional regulator [Kribbella turkmenica]|uniref:Transcriptional regulator n=1 Tax=Kribbella turkmenica TaxID=2530375 RepID=A0A4R4XGS4_9ACTN|nr:transcriptional regulator [Kribbella turkmenica]TDD29995.1 transcriptional regulator [Kribbella turkmenica]